MNKEQKLENKIIELEKRIIELEKKPLYIPQYQPNFNNPNLHYHGSMPCYQNPCYWA